MLSQLFENQIGRIIVSLILGFGLASIFRRVCNGNNCIVVKGPKLEDVNGVYYKIEEDCYKYTPYASPCEEATRVS